MTRPAVVIRAFPGRIGAPFLIHLIASMPHEDHLSETALQPGSVPPADPSARLLANPMLLAGGALVAGVIIGRVLGSDDSRGKRLVDEIAEAILNRSGTAAPAEGNAVPAVERLVEEFRPQLDSVAENLSKMLADLFRK